MFSSRSIAPPVLLRPLRRPMLWDNYFATAFRATERPTPPPPDSPTPLDSGFVPTAASPTPTRGIGRAGHPQGATKREYLSCLRKVDEDVPDAALETDFVYVNGSLADSAGSRQAGIQTLDCLDTCMSTGCRVPKYGLNATEQLRGHTYIRIPAGSRPLASILVSSIDAAQDVFGVDYTNSTVVIMSRRPDRVINAGVVATFIDSHETAIARGCSSSPPRRVH